MNKEFGVFAGWRVLAFFLQRPRAKESIRGVARASGVSGMTAKRYCDLLEQAGLLECENAGLARFFRLRAGDPVVKAWVKAFFLQSLREAGVEKALEGNSFYVFGSAASGEADEESDVDLFVVKTRGFDAGALEAAFEKTGRRMHLTAVDFYRLEEFKGRNKALVAEVRKGVFFGGDGLEL